VAGGGTISNQLPHDVVTGLTQLGELLGGESQDAAGLVRGVMNPASVQGLRLKAAPVGGSDVISDSPALAQARECDDPGRSIDLAARW